MFRDIDDLHGVALVGPHAPAAVKHDIEEARAREPPVSHQGVKVEMNIEIVAEGVNH